jgi:hypothetical protein
MDQGSKAGERVALIAVASTPGLRHVGDEVVQRHWMVRTAEEYSEVLLQSSRRLETDVARFIEEEFGTDYPPADLADCKLGVEMIPVDGRHFILRVRMSARDPGGPARLVAEFELLRRVDGLVGVEELQGFPRRFWPVIFPS